METGPEIRADFGAGKDVSSNRWRGAALRDAGPRRAVISGGINSLWLHALPVPEVRTLPVRADPAVR